MGVRVRRHRGAWWVFVASRKQRKSKRIGDKQTALSVAREIRERLALGDRSVFDQAPRNKQETFEAFADRWLADGEAARKSKTHQFYSFNLELHINPVIGTESVAAITRAHCRKVVAAVREKGLKLASVQGAQRTLSAVLSQAVEDGILPANPAFRMGKHVRRGDEPRRVIEPLTVEEAHRLLKTVDRHFREHYGFFLCALRTGLRLGELIGLRWGDVDLAGGFLMVRRNVVAGKVTTPKNTLARRVDMSDKLIEALEKQLTAAKARALKKGKPLPPWVFPNADGGHLDGDNFRRRVFARALKKAKMREIRIHDLRHTFASHLIQNGESLAYVRDQLGHGSITITVDVYGHLVPGSNRAAVNRLDLAPQSSPRASEAPKGKTKKSVSD